MKLDCSVCKDSGDFLKKAELVYLSDMQDNMSIAHLPWVQTVITNTYYTERITPDASLTRQGHKALKDLQEVYFQRITKASPTLPWQEGGPLWPHLSWPRLQTLDKHKDILKLFRVLGSSHCPEYTKESGILYGTFVKGDADNKLDER